MGAPPGDAAPPPDADPDEAQVSDDADAIDEDSEESFPASDAPQHWAGPPDR